MKSLGYRAILKLDDNEPAVKIADGHIRDWIGTKLKGARDVLDAVDWDEGGVLDLGQGVTLTIVTLRDERDQSTRRLLRLDETNPTGRWIVSVTACSLPKARREKQILLIELEQAGVNVDDALREAHPPRLVRTLLESTVVRDNSTVLSPSPIIIREDNLDEVLNAILDPGRLVSVVVAASPGQVSVQAWQDIVGQLVRNSVGVTAAFVIADSAFELLASKLPPSHSVPRGGVRTFAPKVNLDDAEDGIRHRVLGPATFARSINPRGKVIGTLPSVHAEQSRRRLVESELPAELRRSMDLLMREDARITREARVTRMAIAPAIVDAPTETQHSSKVRAAATVVVDWSKQAVAALIKRWTGETEVSDGSLTLLNQFIAKNADGYLVAREQIDALLESRSELQVEIGQLREQVEEAELSARIDSDGAQAASREARILRNRLRLTERYDETYVEPEEESCKAPEDMEEFILRLTPGFDDSLIAARVVFTGDASSALEINKRDPFGRVVAKMWEYVLVLNDYASTRVDENYAGSVHQYLNDSDATGRKCTPQRHASGESESVLGNARMRRERVFPVPVDVDPSGQILMTAHFKPTHSDTFAPRMYYYDDTANTGKIYIGYVGRHLTNSHTN